MGLDAGSAAAVVDAVEAEILSPSDCWAPSFRAVRLPFWILKC